MSDETYLGDGLYASFDGWQFKLRAPADNAQRPGGIADQVVYLEPNVVAAFEKYVKECYDRARAAAGDPNE